MVAGRSRHKLRSRDSLNVDEGIDY